jgi:MFS family permease
MQSQGPVTGHPPALPRAETDFRALGMFSVLLLAYALMAADRYLFPVLAPDVRHELSFSLSSTGLLSTIFTLGLAIGGLPTGYLLSRLSRKTVLLAGIAIFSAATAMTAIATGFWSMLVCLAATGVGMAMLATVMFTLASSYFSRNRGAAIGSVNLCYGLGAIIGPLLAGALLMAYGTWRAPMAAFGSFGLAIVGLIVMTVRRRFTETQRTVEARTTSGGAATLLNRNTILLTAMSLAHGLILYGFLGLYPTFLRESLHYAARTTGEVMSFFGMGALLSIAGGWLGDRFSPRTVLGTAFLCMSALGYVVFHGPQTVWAQSALSCLYGVISSAVLYVNLAGYHVKAVRTSLASRSSGLFVTSLYGTSAVAGYSMGWLANQGGWGLAGGIQISVLSAIAACMALGLRPAAMSR